MGIKGLMKLISDECPAAVKEHKMEHYNGRVVAVDASMAIYQFLIAIRHGNQGSAAQMLTNEAGEVTSHIQGMFNRTIRMLSSGVKPIFVFDGKPPTLKGGELAKRHQKRDKAQTALEEAKDGDDIEEQNRQSKRLVRASKKDSDDCKTLLHLMGVPYVEAPCEAEAQCAALAKINKVHAVATEDMDALTFETPRLLRNMTMAGDNLIKEIEYKKVIEGMGLTKEQFIDLCILCGCDYCGTVRGIGPKTALNHIKKYGTIERALQEIKKGKYDIPPEWNKTRKVPKEKEEAGKEEEEDSKPAAMPTEEEGEGGDEKAKEGGEAAEAGEEEKESAMKVAENGEEGNEEDEVVEGAEEGPSSPEKPSANEAKKEEDANIEYEEVEQIPAYAEARRLFVEPEIADPAGFEFKWTEPDEAGLEDFLINKLGFNPDRVKSGINKLKASRSATSQKRLDSFFKPAGCSVSSAGVKRKEPEPAKGKGKKAPAAKKGGGKKK